jgi:hypothetical protein
MSGAYNTEEVILDPNYYLANRNHYIAHYAHLTGLLTAWNRRCNEQSNQIDAAIKNENQNAEQLAREAYGHAHAEWYSMQISVDRLYAALVNAGIPVLRPP